jgi:hypothetical protein
MISPFDSIMPDLGKCKVIDGSLYCWDRGCNDFVRITASIIYDRDLRQKVTSAFMNDNSQEVNNA